MSATRQATGNGRGRSCHGNQGARQRFQSQSLHRQLPGQTLQSRRGAQQGFAPGASLREAAAQLRGEMIKPFGEPVTAVVQRVDRALCPLAEPCAAIDALG